MGFPPWITSTREDCLPRATPSSDNPLSGKLFLVETPQGCHICVLTLMVLVANFANKKWYKKLKMTETLAYWYSSDSTQWELSTEYKHDKVKMIFSNPCILVLWTKVAWAFKRLKVTRGNNPFASGGLSFSGDFTHKSSKLGLFEKIFEESIFKLREEQLSMKYFS